MMSGAARMREHRHERLHLGHSMAKTVVVVRDVEASLRTGDRLGDQRLAVQVRSRAVEGTTRRQHRCSDVADAPLDERRELAEWVTTPQARRLLSTIP
jgi:hypothetical protein